MRVLLIEHERRSFVWMHDRLVPYPFQLHLAHAPPSVRDECLSGLPAAASAPLPATASVALGEGVIDWKKVITTAKANGTKAFFYEQEAPFTRPILESVKISGDYLQKLKI